MKTRTERDSLGEVKVPAEAYWGAQTERARANFPISGIGPPEDLIHAYAHVKAAAAQVNAELGLLPKQTARAVVKAAGEVLAGAFDDAFVVDVFQAGAGTSLHMNVNEVLANRANEILGGARGTYAPVHPNDHVNLGQSTNDTFPTALRLALRFRQVHLLAAFETAAAAFDTLARTHGRAVTTGRTHLMDATPLTWGQIFSGYATLVREGASGIEASGRALAVLSLGGTAVGTGLNAHPRYARAVVARLAERTGLKLKPARDRVAAAQTAGDFARYAGALKAAALDLIKIAGDLRLYGSGPTSGLAELRLPEVQPGSSIMPGKVNPVLAEALTMVCFHVIGAEAAVAAAAQAGQFQLNVMNPLIAFETLFAMDVLERGLAVFTERCLLGIEVDEERSRHYAERTLSLATVLNPLVGYERAAEIVKASRLQDIPIHEAAAQNLGLPVETLRRVLDPARWTRPGRIDPDSLEP